MALPEQHPARRPKERKSASTSPARRMSRASPDNTSPAASLPACALSHATTAGQPLWAGQRRTLGNPSHRRRRAEASADRIAQAYTVTKMSKNVTPAGERCFMMYAVPGRDSLGNAQGLPRGHPWGHHHRRQLQAHRRGAAMTRPSAWVLAGVAACAIGGCAAQGATTTPATGKKHSAPPSATRPHPQITAGPPDYSIPDDYVLSKLGRAIIVCGFPRGAVKAMFEVHSPIGQDEVTIRAGSIVVRQSTVETGHRLETPWTGSRRFTWSIATGDEAYQATAAVSVEMAPPSKGCYHARWRGSITYTQSHG